MRKIKKTIKKVLGKFGSRSSDNGLTNFECQKIRIFGKLGFEVTQSEQYFILKKDDLQIKLRRNTSDIYVCSQVISDREYEPVIKTAHLNKISVDTIVDVGANIGLTSLIFAQRFPNAFIISIEPDKGNFSMMHDNLLSISDRSRPYNAALWYKKGKVYLNNSFRDGKEWSLSVSEKNAGIEVDSITMSEVIQENKLTFIDLLKIDIEGAESELFSEYSDLSFLEIVKILAIEIHEETNSRERIISILKKKGFLLFEISETLIAINFKNVS